QLLMLLSAQGQSGPELDDNASGKKFSNSETLLCLAAWAALQKGVDVDRLVKAGTPLLGICLGMQLFADQGFEDGVTKGFGWLPGTVEKISSTRAKIPHMGWNTVNPVRPELFEGIENSTFYFMHSYHFLAANPEDVIATVTYDDTKLVAAVKRDNVYGVQFHPEKSQGDGLRFLKNLLESIA
ncbi:MAG: imidazole glycerol phosphate synthase subunit HisH, partial [Pseudomonadota bacterium]